jgi:homoserine dehydrogenase
VASRYYLRMTVKDQPGVLARIAQITARNRVSIASVIQTAAEPANAASLILTTHQSNERAIRATLSDLARLKSVLEKPLLLRIGDFTD